MANTPNIRFKGFTDAWEQRKLSELITEYKETVDSDCTLPVLTSSKTEGVILQEEHFGRKQNHDITGYNILPRNYCTYRNRSDGIDFTFNINKCCDRGIISKFYPVFCGNNNDTFFISLVLNNSDDVVREIGYTCTGTGQKVLSFLDLQKMSLRVPSYEEQKNISTYFDMLDNLITLQQRKCDETKSLKKYMLQKMFPKNGEQFPEIRFSGFTDAWEQRKLLDCIQKITDFRGRTPKKLGMDWSEEGYLALSALNVKDGYIDFNQDVHYGNQELYDKWMTGNELHKGQVLFTTEAPMGNVAQVPDNRRYILSQRTIAFDVKNKLITENFLATVLRTPTVFADLTALSSGGTAKGVSQKSLASVEIRLPKDLNEQEKIADTFSNLDNLITLHQRERINIELEVHYVRSSKKHRFICRLLFTVGSRL